MRKNPNKYGGITKLSGNRRRPFMAYKNVEYVKGNLIPQELKTRCNQTIERFSTMSDVEIVTESAKLLAELRKSVGDTTTTAEYHAELLGGYIEKNDIKAGYKKEAIGYYETEKEAIIALADANKGNLDYTCNPTFEEIWYAAKPSKVAKQTERSYKSAYKKCEAIHNKPIRSIVISDLQGIIDSYSGSSKSLQNAIIVILHMVFGYAFQHSYVEKDISKAVKLADVKEQKAKTVFSDLEIQKLRQAGHDDIVFLIYTGLRIGEYLALKDEDFEGDILRVHGTKNRTSDRIVPLHPITRTLNLKYRGSSYRRFLRIFNETMESLGMNHTIHETRHTFATITKKFKLEPTLRQYMLGHSNGNITDDVYTHPESLIPELCAEVNKIIC